MKYYTRYGYGCQAKNGAEKEADAYLRTLGGWLLPDEAAKDKFLNDVECHISALNNKYPRCRDMDFHLWHDWIMDGDDRVPTTNLYVTDGIGYIYISPVIKEIP
ncbi:MAG: hypothetical protein LBJ39_01180 [Tannerellaceae bacterium]|jgi:hypothetical protein|nr:hypothetical protein [Tannerellaceae bacterium]